MALPQNKFSITAKIWKEPGQTKNGHPKINLVVDSGEDVEEGKEPNAFWIDAIACQEDSKLQVQDHGFKKYDIVDVEGLLLPPRVWEGRAFQTMFINTIKPHETQVTESQEKVTAQEDSTKEEDIPF